MSYTASKSYARITDAKAMPPLLQIQFKFFNWLQEQGLAQLFDEISPIESYNGNLKMYLPSSVAREAQFDLHYRFQEPRYSREQCIVRDITFAAPLYVDVALSNRETGEIIQSEVFFGDFPLMTDNGTFIINGTERVVVSQLIRSPGVYFDLEEDRSTGLRLCTAKLIPDRGAWLEFGSRKTGYLTVRFNRKRILPVTILLRALAAVEDGTGDNILEDGSDDTLLTLFEDSDSNPNHQYIPATFRQEPEWKPKEGRTVAEEALLEFYRRMRPGDPATMDNAREYLEEQLFDARRYDLKRVGRYKLNQRLDFDVDLDHRMVTKKDVVAIVRHMIRVNNGIEDADDIDHLGNRRIKTVGELVQNKLRIGLRRMERIVVDRMSSRDSESMTPVNLINIRPFVAAIRQFFGSSRLSQFMEQTNPLAELTHKRTLSALGPGGLKREYAGFEVRDVHYTHYGRVCPVETPEGPNIGLIVRLATHARINPFGFIETPYRKVIRLVEPTAEALVGHILREDVVDPDNGETIGEAGVKVTAELADRIASLDLREQVPVEPVVTDQVEFLSADREDRCMVAQSNVELDDEGHFLEDRVTVRHAGDFRTVSPRRVDYIDVAPNQVVGVSAALIPFLEHDDANRALMGSNMQRQGVPLLEPEAPIVGTGVEGPAARDSGQVVLAEDDGEVISVTGRRVIVRHPDGPKTYTLRKFERSNQSSCINQRPAVYKGQRVKKGDVLADSSSTEDGNLGMGQNVLCAFLSWEGGNYEDAILISERLVHDDKFTSIHIEEHELEARNTKLGPEEITRDIPHVGDTALRDLDEGGVIRVGAEVGPLDILVGKITPKGEKELSPEEKLLRAIFGEKARDVKDSSLRMPHGERGTVVDVKSFDREEHRDLPTGVEERVRVNVAQLRKLTEGDKMAGRHGNKGVVSKVVPIEDMPFLPDGTPIDILLNPLGVPGRMNIGQILETHLGWAASRLGFRAVSPAFDGASETQVEADLARAWLVDRAWDQITERAWAWLKAQEYPLESLESESEARLLYVLGWLEGRDYNPNQLLRDRVYARRAVLREWLREQGYSPDGLLVFEDDPRPMSEQDEADQRVRTVCLSIWLQDHGEDAADLEAEEIEHLANRISLRTGDPLPILGKMTLYDGKTGEQFDQPVTVGYRPIMKLHHLVEDKAHARSTGPYSLVTQQPLGGKARFGGQRFGEMEVWALEAYGAAHSLQEMLTVKSDDVQGRVEVYESIVKGEPVKEVGVPASFKVLVKELQSLGLGVEAITRDGEVLRFGKDEEKTRPPRIGMGLLDLRR
ncbi:MAG: DNA-directed RNA polymerase subunit beta [Anaerolineae bacterium]|nr:DNA-directed RNA polymerase subunit beta [Anaerolineae bacterium]